MNSTSSTPMPKPPVYCAYCQTALVHGSDTVLAHIATCDKRPEYGLLLKLQLLYDIGDELLETIHELVKAIGEFEGGMTGAWEIYRTNQEKWAIAKNINPEVLAENVDPEDLKGE